MTDIQISDPDTGSFEVKDIPKHDIDQKIRYYAKKWGVSYHLMDYIVYKESSYNRTAVGDMHIPCEFNGKPVRARGPVQITECYYPQVSDEDAFDWDYSLNFLGKKLAAGNCHEWTTCRRYPH